ncbi:MAG: TIGR04086 family membrane protein [Oscillospiraceae bacterium]
MGKEKREQTHLIDTFWRMVFGGGLGLAVCLFLLGIAALGISKGWLPAAMLSRVCVVGCFIGGFFGGLLALRGGQGKTLLVGLGTGLVFFLFLLVAGVILYRNISPLETGWNLLASALIGGALSGLVAARPKRRKYS